jgi:hypothetical protein
VGVFKVCGFISFVELFALSAFLHCLHSCIPALSALPALPGFCPPDHTDKQVALSNFVIGMLMGQL